MSELFVNRDDLDTVTQILADMTTAPEAPKALLSQLVTHIGAAMDDLEEAPVTVVPAPDEPGPVESIGDQFENAFTPAASSHGVEIRLLKIHR